jgi:hypothetical protein
METRRRMLTEGLIAGSIGYAAIALFYAMLTLFERGSVLTMVRFLGGWLVPRTAVMRVPLAPVLAFNALHLAVLVFVGLAVSWLVYETERHPDAWFLALFAGIVGLFVVEVIFLVAVPGPSMLPWWSVLAANALAALGMGGYLVRAHRRLLRRLQALNAGS